MGFYDWEPIDFEVPRLLNELLVADSNLVNRFGADGIGQHDIEWFRHGNPRKYPYLATLMQPVEDRVGLSGVGRADLVVEVTGYFHPETPGNPGIVQLDAPTFASMGSGSLTGKFRYVATATTDEGESFVKQTQGLVEMTPEVELTDGSVTLALQTGFAGSGLNLYRADAQNGRFRLRAHLVGNANTEFVDGDGDSQLRSSVGAPIFDDSRRVMAYVKALVQTEAGKGLKDQGGQPRTYAVTNVVDVKPTRIVEKNVLKIPVRAIFSGRFELATREAS